MVAVAVGDGNRFTATGAGRAGKPAGWSGAGRELAPYRGNRAKKGQPIPAKLKPTGLSSQ